MFEAVRAKGAAWRTPVILHAWLPDHQDVTVLVHVSFLKILPLFSTLPFASPSKIYH